MYHSTVTAFVTASWTVWGSNAGGIEAPETQPAFCTSNIGSVSGGGGVQPPWRGVNHPRNLTPRLKKEYSYNCNPLWGFMACFRANFTFTVQQHNRITRNKKMTKNTYISLKLSAFATAVIISAARMRHVAMRYIIA